jgi:hypothetical protein
MISLTKRSNLTGKVNTVELPLTNEAYQLSLKAWRNGALIQKAFPTLDADQREFIMTGITAEEWNAHFEEE